MMAGSQARGPDASKLQQQLMSKVDANGDKSIDKSELKSFLDFVSEKTGTTAIDADSMLTSLDSDGDGAISSTEIEDNGKALFDQLRDQLMSAQLSAAPKMDSSEIFAGIDSDGDGAISKTELDSFIGSRSEGMGQGPSADEILSRNDADDDGSISLAEFESAMSHRPGSQSGDRDGGQIGRLMASLLSQYSASTSSTQSTVSATA